MITGVHALLFTTNAEWDRAFFRDLLEFRPISEEGFGLVTAIRLPGGGELGLYQPRHPTPPSPDVSTS